MKQFLKVFSQKTHTLDVDGRRIFNTKRD